LWAVQTLGETLDESVEFVRDHGPFEFDLVGLFVVLGEGFDSALVSLDEVTLEEALSNFAEKGELKGVCPERQDDLALHMLHDLKREDIISKPSLTVSEEYRLMFLPVLVFIKMSVPDESPYSILCTMYLWSYELQPIAVS